jgi:ATP-dependent helicase/nuclease subunit A
MKFDCSQDTPSFDLEDASLSLTAAQAEAMDIHHERMVSAGAGSGKTWTLSLRYTALLLDEAWRATCQGQKASIDAALVLTFTTKAAQEMSQRCYVQLLKMLSAIDIQISDFTAQYGDVKTKSFLVQLHSLADQFDRARIGTFHGFCTQLLREHGLRIGLNPDFRLLDDLEAQELIQKAIQVAYVDWRQEVSTQHLSVLAQCFNGRKGLEEAVTKLIRHRCKFVDLPLQSSEPGSLLTTLLSEAPLSQQGATDWLTKQGIPVLQAIHDCLAPVATPFLENVVNIALASVQPMPTDPLELNRCYSQVLEALCSTEKVKGLGHSSKIGSKKLWKERASTEAYDRAKAEMVNLQASIQNWPALLLQAGSLPKPTDRLADALETALSKLFHGSTQALDMAHKQSKVLDFDGLQIQCLRLLRQEHDLCLELYKRHRFMMVDEFQDTDAIQWEILKRIGRPDGQPQNRLFAVGDLKQAIYSFRGGDVTVFNEARKALGTETTLNINFRSRTEIVTFTNALFAAAMGEECDVRSPWEAHYSAVEAGRDTDRKGVIGLLQYKRSNAKEDAQNEGALAAAICQELLDPHGPYSIDCYGDRQVHRAPPIALLLRRRTHYAHFQHALTNAGIPFQVAKGVGFWEQAEILDLLHGLNAALLGYPIDLVGFLRSPLVGAKDPEIQALASGAWGSDGLHKFRGLELPKNAPATLAIAQGTLLSIALRAASTGLRELCEFLVHETAAHRAWALDGDRENAEANVQKLLDWMTEIEHRGWSHARSLRFFSDQITDTRREPEADSSDGKARVVLQTVHGAKGLEFPVVILGGLQVHRDLPSTLRIGRSPAGWSFACKTPDPTAAIHKKVHNVRSLQIRDRRQMEKEAEDLRLFYVAITRAEDHLFFIGDLEKEEKGSWTGLLNASDQAPAEYTIRGTAAVPVEESEPKGSLQSPAPALLPAFQAAEVPSPLILNPSGIEQHRRCPVQWRLNKEIPPVPRFDSNEDTARDAAALRGTVLHAMLERKSLSPVNGLAAWKAASTGRGWTDELVAQQGLRLKTDLERMGADIELERMLMAPSVAEPSFQIQYKGSTLKGQIDLLWQENGEWVLTDFKSAAIGNEPETLLHHKAQLTAYAWAASRLLGADVLRTEVYSTREATRLPLPELTPQDFKDHEAHLEAIGSDMMSPIGDLKNRISTDPTERPCEKCRFLNDGCEGWSKPC